MVAYRRRWFFLATGSASCSGNLLNPEYARSAGNEFCPWDQSPLVLRPLQGDPSVWPRVFNRIQCMPKDRKEHSSSRQTDCSGCISPISIAIVTSGTEFSPDHPTDWQAANQSVARMPTGSLTCNVCDRFEPHLMWRPLSQYRPGFQCCSFCEVARSLPGTSRGPAALFESSGGLSTSRGQALPLARSGGQSGCR